VNTYEPPPPSPCASCAVSVTACRAKQTNGGRTCCPHCTHDVTDLGATSETW